MKFMLPLCSFGEIPDSNVRNRPPWCGEADDYDRYSMEWHYELIMSYMVARRKRRKIKAMSLCGRRP
jgi:hypothetical protein